MHTGYIQASRALMIASIVFGSFGLVATLVGMKCSKIGGENYVLKGKIAAVGGVFFLLQGKDLGVDERSMKKRNEKKKLSFKTSILVFTCEIFAWLFEPDLQFEKCNLASIKSCDRFKTVHTPKWMFAQNTWLNISMPGSISTFHKTCYHITII